MQGNALQKILMLVWLPSLGACAAVQSEVVNHTKNVPDGIPYFLPKRPFIVTVTAPLGGAPATLTITPGAAEPDLSREFILSPGANLLAKNEFNITVAPNGLLKTSNSTAQSQVATALQNAAASIAGFVAPGLGSPLSSTLSTPASVSPPEPKKIACPQTGTSYQYLVHVSDREPIEFCPETLTPFMVEWAIAAGMNQDGLGKDTSALTWPFAVSGIFFRHELPYTVTVTGTNAGGTTVSNFSVTAPDLSETNFFAVNRSFFSDNTANITISDGVVTAVDQTTNSELASLVGLPATFLNSYTTALGSMLGNLTNVSANQQKLLQQLQSTAVTRNQAAIVAAVQYQVCRQTVAGFDFSQKMTQDQLNAADTAIKAACAPADASSSPGGK